jgi:hypothetical protein
MMKSTTDKTLASHCARGLRAKGIFCEVVEDPSRPYGNIRTKKWALRVNGTSGAYLVDLEAAFVGQIVKIA